MPQAFEVLHNISKQQREALNKGEPPDVQTGADAVLVADILFAWIEKHADKEQKAVLAKVLLSALRVLPLGG